MKLFIGKKWLLLAVATFLLSGCTNVEQKAQDFVQELEQDVYEDFFSNYFK